jgi:hypothetical protein
MIEGDRKTTANGQRLGYLDGILDLSAINVPLSKHTDLLLCDSVCGISVLDEGHPKFCLGVIRKFREMKGDMDASQKRFVIGLDLVSRQEQDTRIRFNMSEAVEPQRSVIHGN